LLTTAGVESADFDAAVLILFAGTFLIDAAAVESAGTAEGATVGAVPASATKGALFSAAGFCKAGNGTMLRSAAIFKENSGAKPIDCGIATVGVGAAAVAALGDVTVGIAAVGAATIGGVTVCNALPLHNKAAAAASTIARTTAIHNAAGVLRRVGTALT
jgi:hypothetical protein